MGILKIMFNEYFLIVLDMANRGCERDVLDRMIILKCLQKMFLTRCNHILGIEGEYRNNFSAELHTNAPPPWSSKFIGMSHWIGFDVCK